MNHERDQRGVNSKVPCNRSAREVMFYQLDLKFFCGKHFFQSPLNGFKLFCKKFPAWPDWIVFWNLTLKTLMNLL